MPRSLGLSMLAVAIAFALVAGCVAVPAASPSPNTGATLDLAGHAEATANLLDEALELYRSGAVDDALDTVGDAYENHFELIEDPLEEIDEPFMHQLELLIAVTIRQQMRDGAPADAVSALVEAAKADLERARDMLR
jgi:hypothetical protein